MTRQLFIWTIFLFSTAFTYKTSIACNCDFPTLPEQIKNADLVAIGQVISITTEQITDTSAIHVMQQITLGQTVTKPLIKIDTIYKGKISSDTVVVYSIGTGNCNYDFSLNKKYIIYGYNSFALGSNKSVIDLASLLKYPTVQSVYWTNKCTLTQLYSQNKQVEIEKIIKGK